MRRVSQRGFTLVELMVVVALIGGLGGMSLRAAMIKPDARDLDRFARAIVRDVTLARRRATATGIPMLIEIRAGSVVVCETPRDLSLDHCPDTAPRPYVAGALARVVGFAADVDTGQPIERRPLVDAARVWLLPDGTARSDRASEVPVGLTVYLISTVNSHRRRLVAVLPIASRPRMTDAW